MVSNLKAPCPLFLPPSPPSIIPLPIYEIILKKCSNVKHYLSQSHQRVQQILVVPDIHSLPLDLLVLVVHDQISRLFTCEEAITKIEN